MTNEELAKFNSIIFIVDTPAALAEIDSRLFRIQARDIALDKSATVYAINTSGVNLHFPKWDAKANEYREKETVYVPSISFKDVFVLTDYQVNNTFIGFDRFDEEHGRAIAPITTPRPVGDNVLNIVSISEFDSYIRVSKYRRRALERTHDTLKIAALPVINYQGICVGLNTSIDIWRLGELTEKSSNIHNIVIAADGGTTESAVQAI